MGPLRKITLVLIVLSTLGASSLASANEENPVDRLLAVVDDDPILESQLDQMIGIGMVEQQDEEDETRFRRRILDGLERSDSMSLDPHKGMFLPYGTGSLLVRDRGALARAHATDADYCKFCGSKL